MNTIAINDYAEDISRGEVEGKSVWFKFGEGEIDTSLTTLWSGSSLQAGTYKYPDYAEAGTAVKMRAKSTSTSDVGNVLSIQGLDKNWKLQSEDITLNGTTYVETQYAYIRVFRGLIKEKGLVGVVTAEELTGGNDYIYLHIEDSGLDINQTQMALYSVPKGYSLYIKRVTCTKLDDDPLKIYLSLRETGKYGANSPFRVQLNYNAAVNGFTDETPHPFPIGEMTDFEARGKATTVKSSDVAVNLFGHLERNNSVPVVPTTFAAVEGDGVLNLSWDLMTPAETQDFKAFKITYTLDGDTNIIDTIYIYDKTAVSQSISGLTNGQAYEFSIVFIGDDNLESAAATVTDTPNEVITLLAIPGVTAPVTGETPDETAIDTDEYTGTITWAPTDDPFLITTVYTATIVLTAKTGYTLTGVLEDSFTVAGATATNSADAGTIAAVFPATEA